MNDLQSRGNNEALSVIFTAKALNGSGFLSNMYYTTVIYRATAAQREHTCTAIVNDGGRGAER